jgi:putative alpha-1,2-mannosidase
MALNAFPDLSRSYSGVGQVTVSPNAATNGTRVTGNGMFLPSFGQGTYRVYFCFDAPTSFVHAEYYQTAGNTTFTSLNSTATFNQQIGYNRPAGVLMAFAPGTAETLEVRMGISWTSTAKACAYAEEEIPDISAFDAVQAAARYSCSSVKTGFR